MAFSVNEIRKDFPILEREVNSKKLVYLDNGATNIKPRQVVDVIDQHYRMEASNVHRGIHFLSAQATDKFEKARSNFRAFLNAKSNSEVVITSGTTASINLVAQSYGEAFLKEGDEILISYLEHHSNIVPWQMLCEKKGCVLKVAPINELGEIIWEDFEALVSEKTKLVSVNYVSNSLGTINPVKEIIDLSHKFGAVCLIDAAQAGAHIPIDVQALDCDFLALSAHKMVGPTGMGLLYAKEELLDKMPPVNGGGDMISTVTFEKSTWNDLPFKFEAGTPNIAGVLGFGAAIEYLNGIGIENIQAYEHELFEKADKALKAIEGIKIFGDAKEKAAVFSFGFEGIHPSDLGSIMDQEGVAIRTGHHCTQPVMQLFKIPGTARASFSFYNNDDDIEKLVYSIEKAKSFLL